jgi:hypothetical protein
MNNKGVCPASTHENKHKNERDRERQRERECTLMDLLANETLKAQKTATLKASEKEKKKKKKELCKGEQTHNNLVGT